jgi:hypothetical protein
MADRPRRSSVNDDRDEENTDAAGNPLLDNEPHTGPGKKGHRIASGDDELKYVTLSIGSNQANRVGQWSLTFPPRVKVWTSGSDGYIELQSGVQPDWVFTSFSKQLIVEGMSPSAAIDDTPLIAMFIPTTGSPVSDTIKMTVVKTQLMEVSDTGDLTPVTEVRASHPTPIFSNVNVSIVPGTLHASADMQHIMGSVRVQGSLDDAASDLIPGEEGQINSVAVMMNGQETPLANVGVTVTKENTGTSLAKPYDFSGTFDQTVSDIELQPGWNLFHLSASNIYGYSGFAEMSTEVVVQPPPDEQTDVKLRFIDPYISNNSGAYISFQTDGGGWSAEQFLPADPPASGQFGLGSTSIIMGAAIVLNPQQPDHFTATVADADHKLNNAQMVFDEQPSQADPGALDTRIFSATRLIEEEDRTDYTNYTLIPGGTSSVTASSGGDIQRLVADVEPAGIADHITGFTTDYGDFSDVPWQQHDLMTLPDSSMPAVMVAIEDPQIFNPPRSLSDDLLTVKGTADFLAGFVVGFTGGATDTVVGTVKLIKAIPTGIYNAYKGVYTTYKYLQNLGVRYVDGDTFEQEKQVYATVSKSVQVMGDIIQKIWAADEAVITAIQTGDYEPLNELSDEARVAIDASVEFFQALGEELQNQVNQMTPYEYGKVGGRAAFEIVSLILPYTKLGEVSKLKVLTEMGKSAEFLDLSSPIGRAFAKIQPLIDGLTTTKMCFVAGTPIHTANGLVPIEQIHAGEWVLSRDEATGEQAYKPVLETVITHPDALYTIEYDPDGDGPAPANDVVTTAPHPFWVVDAQKFIAADDLKLGEHFLLADGGQAEITGLSIEHAAVGATFTTYNFEVEDFHTYFVGEDGVWVHNAGAGLCERVFSLYQQIVDTHALQDSPWEAFKLLLQKTATTSKRIDAALPDTVDEVMRKAYAAAKRADGTIDLAKVPTHAEATAAMAGRMASGTLQSNHTVPRYVQKLFGITDPAVQDTVPSLILKQIDHTGAGGGSFHNILYQHIPRDAAVGQFTNQELLGKLRDAYTEFGRPDVWDVTQEWLRQKGIQ